jgi:hypothetical protein
MNGMLTREAAVGNLKKMFTYAPDSDVVLVDDVFKAFGRSLADEVRNKMWLSNKLYAMRDYDLLERGYAKRNRKSKLIKLTLTNEGRKALKRSERTQQAHAQTSLPVSSSNSVISGEVTPETVYQAVKVLRKMLPSFEVTFEIKPKEEVGQR